MVVSIVVVGFVSGNDVGVDVGDAISIGVSVAVDAGIDACGKVEAERGEEREQEGTGTVLLLVSHTEVSGYSVFYWTELARVPTHKSMTMTIMIVSSLIIILAIM